MPTTNMINCPECRHEFELSSVLREALEAEMRRTLARDYEAKLREAHAAAADARLRSNVKEAELLKQERELAEREQRLNLELEQQLADETMRIREQETAAAREKYQREANERVRAKDDELSEVHAKLEAATAKEADVLKKERTVAERERVLEVDLEKRLAEETQRIRQDESKAAEQKYALVTAEHVREKDAELAEANAKLATAASREAEWLKKQRALADRERQLELEKERAIVEEIAKVRQQDAHVAEERAAFEAQNQRLRDEEQRQKIVGLETTIDELRRKVQQGSVQLQGEAQEVVVRGLLAEAFPSDVLDDVPNGTSGADVVQRVRSPNGSMCGAIVWESKRTKNWSDAWLPKVRDDQRLVGAAAAVIVTQAMPADVRHFGVKDGVWVCAPSHAAALGVVLRLGLAEVAAAKRAAEGSGQKMQILYGYLTGSEFRNHVEAVVEAFTTMRDDLEKERRATLSSWKRRAKQIDRALLGITSLHGDLQGIAGREVLDLPSLAVDPPPALPATTDAEMDA